MIRGVLSSRLPAAACAVVLSSACAGSSFELGENAGQGGFPPLDTRDNLAGAGGGDAGPAGGSGGAAGAGGAPSGPVPSDCGELRAGADDAEVCIGAGTFSMGNVDVAVINGYVAHGPVHDVTLAAFVLDELEVTVGRYRACVTAGACTAPGTTPEQGCTYTASAGAQERFPVTCVNYDAAVGFCFWDGARRLPTEAEWERAARGTTGTTYAWGNDVSCSKAVFGANAQCAQYAGLLPREVGSTPLGASPDGALDLTGNAWEWVNDWFGPYSSAAANNPTGPDNGSSRIIRGGNWQTPPNAAAAFMRRAEAPAAIAPTTFRCARAAAPETP